MALVDGVWQYADPAQTDLVFQLEAISGRDLTMCDVFLNDHTQWLGNEKSRQGFATLRHELTHTYRQHYHDNAMLELAVERYWLALQAVRMHTSGVKLETANNKYRKVQSKRRAGKGKVLTPSQEQRVVSRYKNRVENGEKYGAIRDIAEEFKTSETTIKKLLKSAK